jgi:membrane protease YdiL (CAAX protease family)
MKKAFALYIVGLAAVGLTIWQPSLGWLSPLMYVIVFPICAFWLWRSEGRTLQDLGLRRGKFWRQTLSWGLLLGLMFPAVIVLVQALCGWIVVTPSLANLTYANWPVYVILPAYIVYVLIKMFFIVAIEEFVFRGYFLQRLALGIGVRWAVAMSSALWAIGHLVSMISQGLSPLSIAIGMLTFIVWGTALSLGCLRTAKSLWFPFGIHYGINISFSLLGGFFLTNFQAPQWLIGNPAWSPETGVFGTLVWLAMIGVIWKITASSRVKISRYETNLTGM